jgi:hypothetical protein
MLAILYWKHTYKTLFQEVSPGYLTFSGPSNQLILPPAFTSTLAQRKTSLNCMHNTLFIDACLPGISYESERILAAVYTLNIHCCYAEYYEGEEIGFFFLKHVYRKSEYRFCIVMYVVLPAVSMETAVFWDMTPCSPLMSTTADSIRVDDNGLS